MGTSGNLLLNSLGVWYLTKAGCTCWTENSTIEPKLVRVEMMRPTTGIISGNAG
jgi:hypothetical protein